MNKERKFKYYVSKMKVSNEKRSQLMDMVEGLATLKTEMQKTPITIDEDLQTLEQKSELLGSGFWGGGVPSLAKIALHKRLFPTRLLGGGGSDGWGAESAHQEKTILLHTKLKSKCWNEYPCGRYNGIYQKGLSLCLLCQLSFLRLCLRK